MSQNKLDRFFESKIKPIFISYEVYRKRELKKIIKHIIAILFFVFLALYSVFLLFAGIFLDDGSGDFPFFAIFLLPVSITIITRYAPYIESQIKNFKNMLKRECLEKI